jgi:hypothetical protein
MRLTTFAQNKPLPKKKCKTTRILGQRNDLEEELEKKILEVGFILNMYHVVKSNCCLNRANQNKKSASHRQREN